MAKDFKNTPPQYVINDGPDPVYFGWDGKMYVWDPHPRHGGNDHYEHIATLGMIKPRRARVGGEMVDIGPEVEGPVKLSLVKTEGVPVWRHLCPADMVAEMQKATNLQHKDPQRRTALLIFQSQQLDRWQATAEATAQETMQSRAETDALEKKKAQLQAEIRALEDAAQAKGLMEKLAVESPKKK